MQLNSKWVVKDAVLSPSEKPGGIIWSKKSYDNFEISLEYKTSEKCNSGLFFRTNPKNAVQGGFEVQIASPGLYSWSTHSGNELPLRKRTNSESPSSPLWIPMRTRI